MISSTIRTPLDRVRRLSFVMQGVVVLGAVMAELGLAWVWLSPSVIEAAVLPRLQLSPESAALTGEARLLGFVVSSVPLALVFYALYQAYQLFAGYRRGEILTVRAADRLRQISYAVIAVAVTAPLVQAALGLVLSWNAASGKRHLILSLSFNDYLVAALGGLLLAIAHVMLEAAHLAQENDEIV